jgi:hypothetical protein
MSGIWDVSFYESIYFRFVHSGTGEFYPDAMEWFDKMQSRLSLSQNYLLTIISRIFLGKIAGLLAKIWRKTCSFHTKQTSLSAHLVESMIGKGMQRLAENELSRKF